MLLESLHHCDVSQFFFVFVFFCFCLNVRNKRDLTGADRSHFMGDAEERDRWEGQIKGEAVAAVGCGASGRGRKVGRAWHEAGRE